MKRAHLIVSIVAIAFSSPAVLAADTSPGTAGTSSPASAMHAADVMRAQSALIEKASRDQDEVHAKNLQLMARTEQAIGRQEKDISRWEKILDTWERQQAQYQKYLDSLSPSKGRR
jgi:aspartate oxidase